MTSLTDPSATLTELDLCQERGAEQPHNRLPGDQRTMMLNGELVTVTYIGTVSDVKVTFVPKSH